jgi:outer membrane cobalamin receptor
MKLRLVHFVGVAGVLSANVNAQSLKKPLQLASREPAFYAIVGAHLERAEARDVAVLRERIVLRLHNATIPEALTAIEEQTSLQFAFKPSILPPGATVSLDARDITVAAALTQILLDADVDVQLTPYGLASIVTRTPPAKGIAVAALGVITGRVTNALNGQPVRLASVTLDGTRTTTTSDSGTFHFGNVPVKQHVVNVRMLGYEAWTSNVDVYDNAEAKLDVKLVKSANHLDQVVVTGTEIPTEVKAMPTPVSIVSDSAIARQMPLDLSEIYRQQVPSAVAFDQAAYPASTFFSVRGASTLSGNTQMKVYIDGQDVALPSNVQIDPASIDHIEVIRGPEAAAIYGSDAIGGITQIFTKRGDPGLTRPQVDLQTALGIVQTPYAGHRDVPRQMYNASVRGGSSDIGYNFGGNYSFTNNYIPAGEISKQSNTGAFGGMHYAKGILSVDASARFNEWNMPQVFNPELLTSGSVDYSKPYYQPTKSDGEGFGARLQVTPTSWLTTTATLGVDLFSIDLEQARRRLTTPGDTMLIVYDQNWTRTNLALNASVHRAITADINGIITAGIDHYTYPITSSASFGPTNSGSLNSVSATRTLTTNTGAFLQGQIGLFDRLYLTAGLRVESNTEFGDSLRAPISPRVGLSYVQPIGPATVKVRGSYGSAIRPPNPGDKLYYNYSPQIILANPRLGPERQFGGDAGVDLQFGPHVSFSATYYNQTAINLIQGVQIGPDTSQNQNIGRVRNLGLEFETSFDVAFVQVHAQYAHTSSRLATVGSLYTGYLLIGDQISAIPKHTAGASLTAAPVKGTGVTFGVTYLDDWTYSDDLAYYRCLGGTGSCRDNTGNEDRLYIVHYPKILKFNTTISQQITPNTSAFVTVHNLTNSYAYEITNALPVMGRTTMIGVRLHY